MNEEMRFQRLDAYKVAKELARRVHLARIRDRELRDQATRASKSAFSRALRGVARLRWRWESPSFCGLWRERLAASRPSNGSCAAPPPARPSPWPP